MKPYQFSLMAAGAGTAELERIHDVKPMDLREGYRFLIDGAYNGKPPFDYEWGFECFSLGYTLYQEGKMIRTPGTKPPTLDVSTKG